MAEKVLMPKMGLTMLEGTITEWFKQEGETLKIGEPLFEVTTDKISNEIDSTVSGVLLKILVNKGEKAIVKAPVAVVGEVGENYLDVLGDAEPVEKKEKTVKEEKIVNTVINEEKCVGDYVPASPLAKKTAKEKGIALIKVKGTGPNGRVVERDILNHTEPLRSVKSSALAAKTAEKLGVNINSISKDSRIMTEDVIRFYKNNKIEEMAAPVDSIVPMTQMRKVISERMSQSWNLSPAVTYEISADMTKLSQLKNDLKQFVDLTYTDLIVKVVSKVLLKHLTLNCTIDGDRIIYRNYVNMSVAVAIESGLMVPVIKYTNVKDLRKISQEIKELVRKAKTNTLSPDELTGGTFTVTNMGMYGIESFSPIINQPQTAILGICAIINTPVVNEKIEVEIKPLMKLCLTADHRAIDGAVAAEFMQDLKKHMENPAVLLV